jgi:beta-lactamase class C
LKLLRHGFFTALFACVLLPTHGNPAVERAGIEEIVARSIRPLMERHGVPGMAVGIVRDGQSYVFEYGVASKETAKPITSETLFEIGSVSKTFTAALASYAQVAGRLSMSDPVSKHLTSLAGGSFDEVTLLELATHTTGGMPLQVPPEINDRDALMRYFGSWKPDHPPGRQRTYSNLSIGLLGIIAAQRLDGDFVALMEGKMFPALGLQNTWLNVPAAAAEHHAQGYTDADLPVRLSPGVLGAEAYGVRTTARDLLRWVEHNMRMHKLDEQWQRAIDDTHTGYYRIGAMTQALIWEKYAYPVPLHDLVGGNSARISSQPNPAARLDPASPPHESVLINKTGSTNGFSAYVAFIPARKLGVVFLANKRIPNEARVKVVREILETLTVPAPTK